jgi:hypothetical protein
MNQCSGVVGIRSSSMVFLKQVHRPDRRRAYPRLAQSVEEPLLASDPLGIACQRNCRGSSRDSVRPAIDPLLPPSAVTPEQRPQTLFTGN